MNKKAQPVENQAYVTDRYMLARYKDCLSFLVRVNTQQMEEPIPQVENDRQSKRKRLARGKDRKKL